MIFKGKIGVSRSGGGRGIFLSFWEFSQAFAKECAQDGIRVNAVLPGLTETKFASALTENEALLKSILPLIPQGRVADPAEIAPAFLYLASPASSYVSGICLTVDGGLLA